MPRRRKETRLPLGQEVPAPPRNRGRRESDGERAVVASRSVALPLQGEATLHAPATVRVGRWKSGPAAAVVAAIGLVITLAATGSAVVLDRRNERSLLDVQTRQAAAVVGSTVLQISQPLMAAAEIAQVTQGNATAFRESIGGQTGPQGLFVSAVLVEVQGTTVRPLASVGIAPLVDPVSPSRGGLGAAGAGEPHLRRHGHRRQPGQSRRLRLRDGREHPLRDLRRARDPTEPSGTAESNSAFSDLHFATYIGPDVSAANLATTDVDPASLPLTGETARETLPFGDTMITLVATASHPLGGSLGRQLPWIFLVGGLLLTALVTTWTTQMIRRRETAEQDAATIQAPVRPARRALRRAADHRRDPAARAAAASQPTHPGSGDGVPLRRRCGRRGRRRRLVQRRQDRRLPGRVRRRRRLRPGGQRRRPSWPGCGSPSAPTCSRGTVPTSSCRCARTTSTSSRTTTSPPSSRPGRPPHRGSPWPTPATPSPFRRQRGEGGYYASTRPVRHSEPHPPVPDDQFHDAAGLSPPGLHRRHRRTPGRAPRRRARPAGGRGPRCWTPGTWTPGSTRSCAGWGRPTRLGGRHRASGPRVGRSDPGRAGASARPREQAVEPGGGTRVDRREHEPTGGEGDAPAGRRTRPGSRAGTRRRRRGSDQHPSPFVQPTCASPGRRRHVPPQPGGRAAVTARTTAARVTAPGTSPNRNRTPVATGREVIAARKRTVRSMRPTSTASRADICR